jgi:hypothetical protein
MRKVKLHSGMLLFLLVMSFLLFSACPKASTEMADEPFTIRVTGDSGQVFTGSYVLLRNDGSVVNNTISGTAPKDFKIEGLQVDLTLQKASATGYLEAQILKGRKVVAEGSVSSAYGSLTLIGH